MITPVWRPLLDRPDALEIGDWIYYVPAACDPRLFRLYVEGGFRGVDPLKALLKLQVDGREWAGFVSAYQRFFAYSPQDRALYTAEDPEVEMGKVYPSC